MLLKEFPDIHWLKRAIQQNFSERRSWDNKPLPSHGWPTAILNVKTNQAERTDIKGPFSLFLNLSGSSEVTCDRKSVQLNTDTYLFSNQGQHYDLVIDNKRSTETFNIHFGEKLYQNTIHALTKSNDQLLDDISSPSPKWNQTIRSNFRDCNFNVLIKQVQNTYGNEEKESSLFDLLSYVLIGNERHLRQINDLSSVRSSTKAELIKRIYLSVDFIHAYYDRSITLDQLADVAMLSKFHFLRVFKSLFKVSPHQYIKHIRLQKAIELIKQNQLPLNLVALRVGIENVSSLSRMMLQLTGRRPSSFMSN
ncbi:MAG: AraC family transcriptional regulator [Reichenbachiella sp.]|uniref:helix-turn-helix domain-containing protein n=1 Tax=Reichenbachiella sp. TaxID=2184521 RepID=UPI00329A5475